MKRELLSSALCELSDGYILEAYDYGGLPAEGKERAANKKRPAAWRKRLAAPALAACLTLAFGVTAVAAGVAFFHADGGMSFAAFVKNAFGNVLSGREPFDYALLDGDGNLVKTEHYPGVERVEADAELASALLGDGVMQVNEGLRLGSYTLVLRDFVVDENGIGAFTYEIENPDGLNVPNVGLPCDTDAPYLSISLNAPDGGLVDFREFATSRSDDGTRVSCVAYFTPFRRYDGGALALRVSLNGGREAEEAALPIEVQKTVKAREMRSGDFTFSVSPLGIVIENDKLDAANSSVDRLVLRGADGGEYTVIGDDLYNATVASVCGEHRSAYAFNRLVDVENLEEIVIDAR